MDAKHCLQESHKIAHENHEREPGKPFPTDPMGAAHDTLRRAGRKTRGIEQKRDVAMSRGGRRGKVRRLSGAAEERVRRTALLASRQKFYLTFQKPHGYK